MPRFPLNILELLTFKGGSMREREIERERERERESVLRGTIPREGTMLEPWKMIV